MYTIANYFVNGANHVTDLFCVLCLLFVFVFTIPLALGPASCSQLVAASGTTFSLLGVILFITVLCCCFACVMDSEDDCAKFVRGCIYFCNCLAVMVFLALVITSSALVFTDPALPAVGNGNCSMAATPMVTVAFSYFLSLMYSFLWCCACCCLISQLQKE